MNEVIKYENKKFKSRFIWIVSVFGIIGLIFLIQIIIMNISVLGKIFSVIFYIVYLLGITLIISYLNSNLVPKSVEITSEGVNIKYFYKEKFIRWKEIETILQGIEWKIITLNREEIILNYTDSIIKNNIYNKFQQFRSRKLVMDSAK